MQNNLRQSTVQSQSNLRFRTIFGETEKQGWTGFNQVKAYQDSNILKVNQKYIALSADAGNNGKLCLLKLDEPGDIPHDYPMIHGHTEPVLDFEFFPHNYNYLATCSGDTTIKLWNIPDDLNQLKNIPESTLYGHTKKVNLIQFNPTSEGVLASSGYDSCIKIWDVLKGKEKFSNEQKQDYPYDFQWNDDGSQIASIWKDKLLRAQDPRQKEQIFEVKAHEGGRPTKVVWMGKHNCLLSCGFSKNIERELKIWDIKKPDTPFLEVKVDNNYAVFMPYYDADLDILWLAGKGDTNIKYYEFTEDKRLMNYMNDYKFVAAAKGIAFLPKTMLDVKKTEIAKCAKLTDKKIQLVSFVTSRKSESFQADIYPDCQYDLAQTADEFFNGENKPNPRRSMKPDVEKERPKFLKDIFFDKMDKPAKFVDPLFKQGILHKKFNLIQILQNYIFTGIRGLLSQSLAKEPEENNIYYYKSEIHKLEQEVKQLQATIIEKDETIRQKDEQLELYKLQENENNEKRENLETELQQAMHKVQEQVQEKDLQIQQLKNEIDLQKHENDDQKSKISNFEEIIEDLQAQKRQLEDSNEQLINSIHGTKEDEQQKAQQIMDLESRLKSEEMENQQMQAKNKQLENNIKSLNQKQNELMQHLLILETALDMKDDILHIPEKKMLMGLKVDTIKNLLEN